MITDEQLSGLFAEGTSPERDSAFASRVGAEIGRARLGRRLLALALRALAITTLASMIFMTARAIGPMLGAVAETSPQVMGVPLPLVLGALAVGVLARARRFVRLRLR